MKHVVKMADFGSFKTTIWSIGCIHLVMYLLVAASILNDKALTNGTSNNSESI